MEKPDLDEPVLILEMETDIDVLDSIIKITEIYISFIFISMNIASPGSAELFALRADFKSNEHGFKGFSYWRMVQSWDASNRYGWPNIQNIKLEKVVDWILKMKIFNSVIAENIYQRIIFSLLNIS